MIIQINVPDGDVADMFAQMAADNNMTPVQYARSILVSYIQPRIREFQLGRINSLTNDELKLAYDAVVKSRSTP